MITIEDYNTWYSHAIGYYAAYLNTMGLLSDRSKV